MNIDHLRDFLCVAETLNLTHAADRRSTTQSNLSKRLRRLEDYVGRALIDRGSRPLFLTKAGEDFVPVARQVLSDLDSFRGQSIPWSPSEGGVSIVMPHSVTFTVFPKFKEWLSDRISGVHFAPLLANHDTAARMIARSEIDLAIVTRHPSVPLDDNWSALRYADIGEDRLVIIEPPGTPANRLLPLHVSHPLTYVGQIWQACRGSLPDLPVSREMPHGMAADIKTRCLSNGGRGVLPESLIEADVAAGRIAVREYDTKMTYTISLFCSPQATRRAKSIWSVAEAYFG